MAPELTNALMPSDCHQEKKTTDFTMINFERGRIGASSSWQAVYINTKQYNAHIYSKEFHVSDTVKVFQFPWIQTSVRKPCHLLL